MDLSIALIPTIQTLLCVRLDDSTAKWMSRIWSFQTVPLAVHLSTPTLQLPTDESRMQNRQPSLGRLEKTRQTEEVGASCVGATTLFRAWRKEPCLF